HNRWRRRVVQPSRHLDSRPACRPGRSIHRDAVRRGRDRAAGAGRLFGDERRRAADDAARDIRGDRSRSAAGTAMNQTLHILKKDVKRLRWPLAAWIVVVAGHMLARTITLAAPLTATGSALAMQNLSTLFTGIEALMLALIVSLLVHDEPLVGADAFWLTRPIDTAALVAAKLVSAAGFVILLPLAVEIALV